MNKNFSHWISGILITLMTIMPACAIDLDYTIDDEIRKNYGVGTNGGINVPQSTTPKQTKSEPLPKLPAPPKSITTTIQKPSQMTNSQSANTQSGNSQKYTSQSASSQTATVKSTIPLRKGMEFELLNINAISDKQKVGTNIVFVSKYPIRTAYYTFPQGTKFVGRITESHAPQITGNGGLVSLEIITIISGGEYQHIDSRVTHVDGKRIYYENIKGKRSYWENTVKKGKWGRKVFHKTNKVSNSLWQDKATIVLSPFTFAYGAAMGAVSTAASPVISIFCKGKNVNIPVNTSFKIRLTKDAKIFY